MDAIHTLDFEEFVDLLRERLFDADALARSTLHEFRDLMSDYAGVTPEGWYDDAFEELVAQGHLDPDASGRAFGGSVFGRLSADGRLHVRRERSE
jgi:hypothetical protein